MWADRRILDLFGIDVPIVQAPMAGAQDSELAIAVSEAGGLGSLPCGMLGPDQARAQLGIVRQRTSRPVNVNFFSHVPPGADARRVAAWKQRLAAYYAEFGLDPESATAARGRTPFDDSMCDLVLELKPRIVSFHFGLPPDALLDRVKSSGAKILSTATTVKEARWLESNGCDAIIAQGYEAGGHRGMFLSGDLATQVGTFALVPQVVDAVDVPVVAAGGIADARGLAAAVALGASAVQIGSAYLRCPESKINAAYRAALGATGDDQTVLTNVFTGRPARGIVNRLVREVGPISDLAPEFPLAGAAVAPLKSRSEELNSPDFLPLWSGQSAALGKEIPAGEFTRRLAAEAAELLQRLSDTAAGGAR